MSEYLYEMHMHCFEASKCGQSAAIAMVQAYKNAGYAGAVLTDHFIFGNTAVPKDLPWAQRMAMYYAPYLAAKRKAEQLDFDVLFGIEHAFGQGKEILVYGVTLELLAAHPEIETLPPEQVCALFRENGCYVSLAHPYRMRPYITVEGITLPLSCLDALEVYNTCNKPEENPPALRVAVENGLGMTSGGDIHRVEDAALKKAGLVFSRRIQTNEALVEALKAGDGRVLWDGKLLET